ncbi:carbon monoxide dehydrogenase [Azospirillum baldaniorum]|uniref:Carbon monoxide dehydrogenase medium subunit n=1 Tax=Azospirillum baldaniorum TaxID=1064539 RepID=A0A9P1JR47_9PROT|nr:xanthine dehydrogenase family protein subunit M [Azospirillum baldaniorum]AWJ89828.1 carbon monoxide dehydrogenase [Azospirillum baldaniorum]TWA75491.1 carbon-monoxide dehydrogenase medium subunit [Azospirillum brasilense]CCC98175.1 carbon monoxide dehydrogenase medium subunit [Azospirillum baldaniorum]
MYAFTYHRPKSVADAVALLGQFEDPKLLGGGQTLLPTLKQRLARPSDLIDLGQIPELQGIREEAGGLTVGAFTRHAQVAHSDTVQRVIPALASLAEGIGDRQVRNMGTLGGSICNADPSADYPAAAVALKATVRTDRREIAGDDFFTGMFETALEPGEIVTAVHFQKPDKAAYAKFRNPASRYAIVGVFVAVFGSEVRVAVTGAGPSVFRADDMEAALAQDFRADALNGASVSADGLNADIHASADYRAHLVRVMARRAVEACG